MKRITELTESPARALANWREIRDEIFRAYRNARSEGQRDELLRTFLSTMTVVEGTLVTPDQLPAFREARDNDYKSMLVEEATIGGALCMETLDRVTRREIMAGRMPPDASLRRTAEEGMAAPHPSQAELLARQRNQPKTPFPGNPRWQRSLASGGRWAVVTLPYLIVPWVVYRLNNGDQPIFWITLGGMLAARLFFDLTEIAAEEFEWRLTRRDRVAAIVAYLKENNFPDPTGKPLGAYGDYFGYMGAIAMGEMQPPRLRELARREEGIIRNVEPFQGFLTRLRFHSILDQALKQHGAELAAGRAKETRP